MAVEYREAVLDASLLVETVVREEYTGVALELVRSLEAIYVPSLAPYEVGNALAVLARRGLLTGEEAARKYRAVSSIPTLAVREPRLDEAVGLAAKLDLTVYDAAYLVLAAALGVPLITADKDLAEAGEGVARVIHASKLAL